MSGHVIGHPMIGHRMIGHAIRRRGCEMRAPILDQPLTPVADGHVEKVDRDHGDDLPIWTVDIVQGNGCQAAARASDSSFGVLTASARLSPTGCILR